MCLRGAAPAVVVFLCMAGGENPLRASPPTAGFVPKQSAPAIGFTEHAKHGILKLGPTRRVKKGGKPGEVRTTGHGLDDTTRCTIPPERT